MTALDPSKSTGTRVVAALNVAATAAAYLPIPGAALVSSSPLPHPLDPSN
jgi:hypothetical protein